MSEETEKLYKKALELEEARTKSLADYVCSMLKYSARTLDMDIEEFRAEYDRSVAQNELDARKVGIMKSTIELMLERARNYQ